MKDRILKFLEQFDSEDNYNLFLSQGFDLSLVEDMDNNDDVLLYFSFNKEYNKNNDYSISYCISSYFVKDLSKMNVGNLIQNRAVHYNIDPNRIMESIEYNYNSNEEAPYYIRNFTTDISNDQNSYIEISQILTHFLDVYFVKNKNAYCLHDENGKLIEVISITEEANFNLITIKRKYLDFYLWATNKKLVKYFRQMTYTNSFHGWTEKFSKEEALGYHSNKCKQKNGAFFDGWKAFPILTDMQKLKYYSEHFRFEEEKYADFKILDYRNGGIADINISPKNLTNFFEKKENKPWELSPIFFSSEVFNKYNSSPELYTITDTNIYSNSWSLRSYGVNKDNLVYVYAIDLQKLPYKEQLYWASFNVEPKNKSLRENISEKSFQSDFKCEFCKDDTPTFRLNSLLPALAHCRELITIAEDFKINALYDDNPKLWSEEIANLHNIFINSLNVSKLRKIVQRLNESEEKVKNFGSIVCIEELFRHYGLDTSSVSNVKDINLIRNHTYGHKDKKKMEEFVESSRDNYGRLDKHYSEMLKIMCEWTENFIELYKKLEQDNLLNI